MACIKCRHFVIDPTDCQEKTWNDKQTPSKTSLFFKFNHKNLRRVHHKKHLMKVMNYKIFKKGAAMNSHVKGVHWSLPSVLRFLDDSVLVGIGTLMLI